MISEYVEWIDQIPAGSLAISCNEWERAEERESPHPSAINTFFVQAVETDPEGKPFGLTSFGLPYGLRFFFPDLSDPIARRWRKTADFAKRVLDELHVRPKDCSIELWVARLHRRWIPLSCFAVRAADGTLYSASYNPKFGLYPVPIERGKRVWRAFFDEDGNMTMKPPKKGATLKKTENLPDSDASRFSICSTEAADA